MTPVSPTSSPSPTGAPALDLLTNGLNTSELWALLWPGLAGAAFLAIGAAAAAGYVRRLLMSDWPPHWARGLVGLCY
jgi:hypothetical protein